MSLSHTQQNHTTQKYTLRAKMSVIFTQTRIEQSVGLAIGLIVVCVWVCIFPLICKTIKENDHRTCLARRKRSGKFAKSVKRASECWRETLLLLVSDDRFFFLGESTRKTLSDTQSLQNFLTHKHIELLTNCRLFQATLYSHSFQLRYIIEQRFCRSNTIIRNTNKRQLALSAQS